MAKALAQVPDRRGLALGLAEVLQGDARTGRLPTILQRRRNVNCSTFPSEIVTCRLAKGRLLRLLCKYGAEPTEEVYGHKGGVPYEAAVYHHVLQPLSERIPIVRFHGAHTDAAAGLTWLVLDYLDDSARIHLTADPYEALTRAADWLGRFHAVAERHAVAGVLNRYDADYYGGWAERTLQFAGPLRPRYPWLPRLCRRFAECSARLVGLPGTIIHGEYYPKNILIREDEIYPVDWESAAWASGEVDLATLTEGWPADVVRRCERAYSAARWPAGEPEDFGWRLTVCRLYGLLRWLGDRPEWTTSRGALRPFKQLGCLGRELGVL